MDDRSQLVERALGYPYEIPPRSYVLADGETHPLESIEMDLTTRVPLLAYGSNAAPAVLAAKLSGSLDPVPVRRAVLRDFDVVYSAHISRYGSVPAALQRSPGTQVAVSIAHLTAEQLRLVSATEPNYELTILGGIDCRIEDGGSLDELSAYMSRHGCLVVEGREVALALVAARGRTFPAMSQREVLEHMRDLLHPEKSLERFIVDRVAEGP